MKQNDKLDQRVPVPMSEAMLSAIDEWRRPQRPIPTRAEACRRLIDESLKRQKEPPKGSGARTIKDFMQLSDLSRSMVYRLLQRGDLQSSQVGGIRLIDNDSWLALLERTRVPPKTKPQSSL